MDGAMLPDDGPTVDGYHLTVGKGFLDDTNSLLVFLGLLIDGNKYGSVDDEEVGIRCRQSLSSLIFHLSSLIYRIRHGQLEQPIGLVLSGTEGGELLLHFLQIITVWIRLVVTASI